MKYEFKGTPKEGDNWVINLNNSRRQVLIENICIIDEGWHVDKVKEDAHLIAAAPDLLQACIDLLQECEGAGLSTQLMNDARSAIHKALNLPNDVG